MPSHTVGPRIRRLETRTAPVWRALADPTRRRVLDLLLDGPRITGDISSHFRISRIAVTRYLEVLSDAVRRFAFHTPAAMPMAGKPPAPEGPGRFPTGYFASRQEALGWLMGDQRGERS